MKLAYDLSNDNISTVIPFVNKQFPVGELGRLYAGVIVIFSVANNLFEDTIYVDLLNIKRKQFADEISIDETLLSQFINQHRMPPDYVAIRLEIHSNNSIPATYWFKLVQKQREHELKTDKELRRKETKNVHRRLAVKF